MPKHSRKRQKTKAEKIQSLGAHVSVAEDADKDDEERQLESFLFGVPFVPSGKGRENILVNVISDDEQGEEVIAGKETENLADEELFYIDDNDIGALEETVVHYEEQEEEDALTVQETVQNPPKDRKPPAWTDPDDTTLKVSLVSDKRLRKLRDAPTEDAVGGREYERRLRRQYEQINPTPEWADNARKKLHPKRRRSSVSSASGDEDGSSLSDLLASTSGILGPRAKSRTLDPNVLAIERLRDANQAAAAEGEVRALQFHPSPHIPVLMSGSADRRVRFFNVDGHTNPHIQTLHIPDLPLTNAVFHPSGSSVLFTGPRPFYYTHDLQSGRTYRSPRGLWGTTFNSSNPSTQNASIETCAFNPTGEVLAVAGRRGYVHLLDWKSGAAQVVNSLKMNTPIKALWWANGLNGDGKELMTLGENSEVYVWDVRERRCVSRWKDEGGFGSIMMEGDRGGNYLAVASNTGLVNVYDSSSASLNTVRPKLLKTIGNLTTSISTLRFNHDSQLLAIASKTKKDHMRMIHLPSLTAFGNWPTSKTPLGHVSAIDFSAGSEYVAIGNNRGRILLYHLRDFGVHQ